jgi:hypothetical protein
MFLKKLYCKMNSAVKKKSRMFGFGIRGMPNRERENRRKMEEDRQ